jgi:hypothetical protein
LWQELLMKLYRSPSQSSLTVTHNGKHLFADQGYKGQQRTVRKIQSEDKALKGTNMSMIKQAIQILTVATLGAVIGVFPSGSMAQTIAVTPGTISTLLGTGTAGEPANGSVAGTSTAVEPVYAIAIAPVISGSGGDIYFSESTNYVKVIYEGGTAAQAIIAANAAVTGTTTPTIGNIYTIAGKGGTGAAGTDGVLSTSSKINGARGLAVDPTGNLFIADSGNNKIRIVYAGTGGVASALITLENTGTTPTTGYIYTVAGSGTAGTVGSLTGNGGLATSLNLNSPRGLYVDSSEDIYIADEATYSIRLVYNGGSLAYTLLHAEGYTAPVSGTGTGYAYIVAGDKAADSKDTGDGALGFNGAGTGTLTSSVYGAHGVGVNPTTGDVYMTAFSAFKVHKLTCSTGIMSTIGGPGSTTVGAAGNTGDGGLGTSATFSSLRDITVDAGGNVYIADASVTSPITSVIRKIDQNGYVSTIAGTNGTICAAPTANPACGDTGNATAATLNAPFDVKLDASGNLIIADDNDNRIRKVIVNAAITGSQGYSATSTGSFAFSATQSVNTSSSAVTALISNLTGASVTPSAISIPSGFTQTTGGTAIDGASDCSTSTAIAAGHTCMLELEFAPLLAQAYSGTATVTVSGTGGNTVSIPVTGTATTGSTSSTTSLVASPSSSTYNTGVTITFTATVTSGATGSVLFYNNGSTLLGTATITSGTASFATSSLVVGSYSVTAVYGGNATYASSTSSAVVFTVQSAAATSTVLTVSPTGGSYAWLTPLTFTATVTSSGSPITGSTVTFSDTVAGTLCSSVSVNASGVATCAVSNLAVSSSHSVTAVFAANGTYASSTSNAVAITITAPTPVSTTTTLTPSSSSADLASSVTLSVSVTGSATNESYPTGTVTLTDTIGGTTFTLGSVTLSNGSGSLVTSTLPFGANSIGASYSGDTFYLSGAATASTVTITATRLSMTPGVINAIVGNGTSGSSTSPTGAATYQTTAVRLDALGNVYFVDAKDVVRVYNPTASAETIAGVSVPAGTVTTLAGTSGTACGSPTNSCGDSGVSTSATLNVARGIALDSYGNIYISDAGDNRVRVIINSAPSGSPILSILTALSITPTVGNIYTIAGNGSTSGGAANGTLATGQNLNSPRNLLIDGYGNIVFADLGGNKVRVLYTGGNTMSSLINTVTSGGATAAAGHMYTIAGSGSSTDSGDGTLATSAGLAGPTGVTFDASGNLLEAEYNGQCVRKINMSTGIITLVAGTEETLGYAGDGGAATSAKFHYPRDMWVDWAGNIYISDFNNNRVRMINTSGIISTVAGYASGTGDAEGDGGAATSAYLLPEGVTFDSSGNLVFTDYNNYVRRVSATSGALAFSTTTVNATSTLTAVLSNTGNTSITFTSIGSLPTGFAQTASGGTNCTGTITLASGASCNLQVAFTPTSASSYTGTVTIASNAATISIALSGYGGVASTNTLSSSTTAVKDGGTVTLTAAVSSSGTTPTGVVNFYYTAPNSTQQTWFAVGTLSSGTVTTAATALPAEPAVGSYTFTAQYAGDSNNAASISNAVVIADGGSTTAITAPSSATAGSSQTITVAVTGLDSSHTPTGTVTLTATPSGGSATTLLSAAALSSGSVSYTGTTLPIGTDTLTATYSGDSYNASSTGTASVTVNAPASTTTIGTISPASPVYGQSVSVPVTVTGATPTGNVTLSVDGSAFGAPQALTSGVVSFAITGLSAGSHTFTAAYAGDANNAASSTSSGTIIVVARATLTVTANSFNIGLGQSVPTYTVSYGAFQYSDTSAVLSGSPVLSTTPATPSAVGTYTITVTTGTLSAANYSFSFTNGSLTINAGTSTTALTTSTTSVVPGQPLTLTATVSGSGTTPTGTVTFTSTSTGASQGPLGTATLVNGVATYYGLIWGGTDTVTAIYNGDSNYGSSTSNAVTVSNFPIAGLQFNWPFINWAQPVSYGASSGTWPVTLQNLTGATVTPTIGIVNPNFVISGSNCGTLIQGATCTFNVTFSPTSGGSANGTKITSVLTATAGASTVSINVTGIAVSNALTFNWPFLNFTPTVSVGATSSPWPVTMTNQSGSPTTINSITVPDASYIISSDNCTGQQLAAFASCTFNVSFSPIAADVTTSGTNVLSSTLTATGNSGAVNGTLTVGGWAAAALGFNWPFITFQNQSIGTTGTNLWPVTVTNYSSSTVSGLSYTFGGTETNYQSGAFTLTNTCSSLAPGASCTFDIAPSPVSGQSAGAYSAQLVVSGSGLSSPALLVSGSATAGGYSINWNQDQQAGVSTIDFGPQNTANATAGPWPITVYNNTGSPESLSLTPSLGVFTTDSSTCGSVSAGGTCSFNLYFTPTADISYQGTLTIAGGGYTCVINTWGGANK